MALAQCFPPYQPSSSGLRTVPYTHHFLPLSPPLPGYQPPAQHRRGLRSPPGQPAGKGKDRRKVRPFPAFPGDRDQLKPFQMPPPHHEEHPEQQLGSQAPWGQMSLQVLAAEALGCCHSTRLFCISFWRKAPSGLCNPAEQVLAAHCFPGTRTKLSAVETLQPLSQKLGQSQAQQKAARPPPLASAWHQQSHWRPHRCLSKVVCRSRALSSAVFS